MDMNELSNGQAKYILERLVADKVIRPRDVAQTITQMKEEISQLETRLSLLRTYDGNSPEGISSHEKLKATQQKTVNTAQRTNKAELQVEDPSPVRRAIKVTPEIQKNRQLQGQYLSMFRQFKTNRRKFYAKVCQREGREVAIKQMAAELKQANA